MGASHDDLPSSQLRGIKGMHRLPVLVHDVVGQVHEQVDGTHTRRLEALDQPIR